MTSRGRHGFEEKSEKISRPEGCMNGILLKQGVAVLVGLRSAPITIGVSEVFAPHILGLVPEPSGIVSLNI